MSLERELIEVLLSWAVFLSPYDAAPLPEYEYKPHSFFVESVCGGKECSVLAWYNNKGTVYFDRNIPLAWRDQIAVHEFVHYLQDKQGDFDPYSCEDRIKREIEAQRVQNQFSVAVGKMPLRINTSVLCVKQERA